MGYSDDGCLHIHIPKCAGTSIEVALNISTRYPRIGREITKTSPDYDRLFGGGLQHLSAREIKKCFPGIWNKKKYCFSVFRNPIERFCSYVSWRNFPFEPLQTPKSLRDAVDREMQSLRDAATQYTCFKSPESGLDHTEGLAGQMEIQTPHRHLAPQMSFISENGIQIVDETFTLDDLPILPATLRRHGFRVNEFEHRMLSRSSKAISEILAPGEIKFLRDIYAADFSVLESIQCCSTVRPRKLLARTMSGLASSKGRLANRGHRKVPKTIWMYWHQGWSRPPPVVRACLESWERENPEWQIRLLCRSNIGTQIELPSEFIKSGNIPIAALSDLIRMSVLETHGGIWADATLWCCRPLDDWIPFAIEPAGFFAYEKFKPDRPISTWFLASEKRNPVVSKWRQKSFELWHSHLSLGPCRERVPERQYHWAHGVFSQLIENDADVASLWAKVPKVSAKPPHLIQRLNHENPCPDHAEFHARLRITNVYKLNRRHRIKDSHPQSALRRLVTGRLQV